MNIFYSDECPYKAAENLDSKRVIKMILESAQIINTALYIRLGAKEYEAFNKPFKCRPAFINHPCCRWASLLRDNLDWIYDHFMGLTKEYKKRYHRIHCYDTKRAFNFSTDVFGSYDYRSITPIPNCTIFKEEPNTILAYRRYLCYKWEKDIENGRPPKWDSSQERHPDFWKEYLAQKDQEGFTKESFIKKE